MDLATRACYGLSLKLMPPPDVRTVDYGEYAHWRSTSLSKSWARFSDADIAGKDVLDFGCGDGPLSLFLGEKRLAKSITGVDLIPEAIARANASLEANAALFGDTHMAFLLGGEDRMPVDDAAFDTILAFDCMEHVMAPAEILAEWHRVLRPGGKALVEWFPYKGPWGPHMEALIPIPWAHVLFGERAMLKAAAEIYDHPRFTPRHWDLDESGAKKPNKWRQWATFKEQAYINQLDVRNFRRLVDAAGFDIVRLDRSGFGHAGVKKTIGDALMALPVLGEYATSFTVIELQKRG